MEQIRQRRGISMYERLVRPLLFRLDAETAHNVVLGAAPVAALPGIRDALRCLYGFDDDRLRVSVSGLNFSSPLCLAAGLDKDCRAALMLDCLGFAALELGGVTPVPQPGNPRPRIFRLRADGALINRMGFPSCGAETAAYNLWRTTRRVRPAVIGLNLAKGFLTPLDRALEDYLRLLRTFYHLCDYFSVDVSCPNVPGFTELQKRERLEKLICGIQAENHSRKPIWVKVSPDLSEADLGDVADVCLGAGISALVATNTTVSRPSVSSAIEERGGLSGKPLFEIARDRVRFLRSRTGGQIPIVACGGIESADDVISMMKAGASLCQLYTGLIYRGPGLVKRIKRDLASALSRDGRQSVSEYIGSP